MLEVPFYYQTRPYQRAAWKRRLSGDIDIDIRIWHRQAGKDTDDIEDCLMQAWLQPGTQAAYVGLDNKWIRRNIWDKYIDGRTHFSNYPADMIDVNTTAQTVKMLNNPPDKAPALVQYIGFKEASSLIGSSYERFYISELSLYRRGAFDFIYPIWDLKKVNEEPLFIAANFTPRGMSNIAADFLRSYTGEDEPEKWPGLHKVGMYTVYVDLMPANKSVKNDGTRLLSDEQLDSIRQRYIRATGNDLLFRQEYLCEFLAVNAGLVFPGIELVRKEKRYCSYNLDPSKPVYMAWDISSKDKQTDWTSCIVFQYYNGRMFIFDWYEDNRKAVVECVNELAKRDYFYLIRGACLPWDSDRSGSSTSPLDECRRAFPGISWYKLDRTYVSDGVNRGRMLLGNAIINSDKCDWLMECFENWEYKELSSIDDWAATPKHDRYSHLMDAYRYAADMLEQVSYIKTNDGMPPKMPSQYKSWNYDEVEDEWEDLPPGMRPSKFSKLRKKSPREVFGWSEE